MAESFRRDWNFNNVCRMERTFIDASLKYSGVVKSAVMKINGERLYTIPFFIRNVTSFGVRITFSSAWVEIWKIVNKRENVILTSAETQNFDRLLQQVLSRLYIKTAYEICWPNNLHFNNLHLLVGSITCTWNDTTYISF